MTPTARPWLVMIAGPSLSGTDGDPAKVAANRARLEAMALPIYERGHLPLIGEWLALPIIHAAGGREPGDGVFDAYQYPVAHRLLERCDALLRLPGVLSRKCMALRRAATGQPARRGVGSMPGGIAPTSQRRRGPVSARPEGVRPDRALARRHGRVFPGQDASAPRGADLDVERARALGLPVCTSIDELPRRTAPAA
jgi:hypothetical protein